MDFDAMLRQHVTEGEPPLGLTSAGLIKAARGQHRTRIAAVAAGVSAVTLIGTLTLAAPGAPPGPDFGEDPGQCITALHTEALAPEPGMSELLAPMPLPRPLPSAVSPGVIDPTQYPTVDPYGPTPAGDPSAVADPSLAPTETPHEPIACFLAESVHRIAPDATAGPYDQNWPPFTVHWDETTPIGGLAAAATLRDSHGFGLVQIFVGANRPEFAPQSGQCLPQPCQVLQGPHGEHVETFSTVDGGRIAYTVYVWSGASLVVVRADNFARRPVPVRHAPFLTMEQLIEIGCDQALKGI
jgi:hypothetical protein